MHGELNISPSFEQIFKFIVVWNMNSFRYICLENKFRMSLDSYKYFFILYC
jgi:hypothetical protein